MHDGMLFVHSRGKSLATMFALLLLVLCLLTKVKLFEEEKRRDEIEAPPPQKRTKLDRFLEVKDVCHDVHVFLEQAREHQRNSKTTDGTKVGGTKKHGGLDEASLIAAMLALLIVSTIASLADVLKFRKAKAKESEERERGEKRSLAEFADKKRLRKERSIGGIDSKESEGAARAVKLYRFESVGSAFARMRRESTIANVLPGSESPNTPPAGVAKPPLKLLGARPPPLLRRSSFPAALLIDGVEQQQRRRCSIDSEEESSPDASRRRIRIIRRH